MEPYACYADKCQLRGAKRGLIVVSTPDEYANRILVPDYVADRRIIIEDRQIIVVVHPARSASYVVIAGLPKVAYREANQAQLALRSSTRHLLYFSHMNSSTDMPRDFVGYGRSTPRFEWP